jgi:hypothetical protein
LRSNRGSGPRSPKPCAHGRTRGPRSPPEDSCTATPPRASSSMTSAATPAASSTGPAGSRVPCSTTSSRLPCTWAVRPHRLNRTGIDDPADNQEGLDDARAMLGA